MKIWSKNHLYAEKLSRAQNCHKSWNVEEKANITHKKGKRKVQGVPQSQTTALPRHQEEEETGKIKQAQIEQTHEKH